jgi:hypothetical protein
MSDHDRELQDLPREAVTGKQKNSQGTNLGLTHNHTQTSCTGGYPWNIKGYQLLSDYQKAFFAQELLKFVSSRGKITVSWREWEIFCAI